MLKTALKDSQAEVSRLRAGMVEIFEAAARITELEQQLAEARGALKPFKDRLFDRTTFEEALYGKKYWAADCVEIYVPIGDLRRAARALSGKGE